MEKEKIREVISRELMLTRFWNSHPSTMKDLEDSLVEALHQALSMSGVVSGAKQLCPKCSGQGIVSKPPHIAGDQNEWTGIELSHKCNLCDGKMVI